MIQGKVIQDEKKLSEVYGIWRKVFHCEENNYKLDNGNIYIVLYEGLKEDSPIGAVMLDIKEDGCQVKNLAILEEKRGQQNGEFILRYALDKGFQQGFDTIFVFLKESQEGLFLKLGFQSAEKDKKQQELIKYQINRDMLYKPCQR